MTMTGHLVITNDMDAGECRYEHEPFVPSALDRQYIGGVKTTEWLELALIMKRNDRLEITALPLALVLASAPPEFSTGYQMYQHDFLLDGHRESIKGASYIGITKRGWRTRWAEHVRSANSGSHYRFHQAIRQWHGVAGATLHAIVACGLSEQQAMAAEEEAIRRDTLYPNGLNMVPGGNAGLAYLRQIGAIGASERVAPDDRQTVINRFFERATRKGLPNPLAAANWLSPDYAEKVICAGPDRLKPQQIRDARYFASMGRDAADIAQQVGARNVLQVQRLLTGSTYSRIA